MDWYTFMVVTTLYFSVSRLAAMRWVVLTVRLTSKLPPMAATFSLKSSYRARNAVHQKKTNKKHVRI